MLQYNREEKLGMFNREGTKNNTKNFLTCTGIRHLLVH